MRIDSPTRRDRCGTAAVEFAVAAIPLFLILFASIEMGRAIMGVQSMEEAARSGCRACIVKGATNQDATAQVARTMESAGIADYTVAISPADVAQAEQWTPVSVTVSATFDDIGWLPSPRFLANRSFSASCTLPKECKPE